MKRAFAFALIFTLNFTPVFAQETVPDEPPPENIRFGQIDEDVFSRLFSLEKDLTQWGAEQADATPADTREAFLKLAVCIRAGKDRAACETIRFLKDTDEATLAGNAHEIGRLLAAIPTMPPERNELLQTYVDACFLHMDFQNGPLHVYLANTQWSPQEQAVWVKNRFQDIRDLWRENEKNAVAWHWDHNSLGAISRVYWQYINAGGMFEEELAELETSIRQNPGDMSQIRFYLISLYWFRRGNSNFFANRDISDVCKAMTPPDGWEQSRIGEMLFQMGQYELATTFFERASEASLAEAELDAYHHSFFYMGGLSRASVDVSQIKQALFRAENLEKLSRCLVALGQGEKAQSVMEHAVGIREEHGIPMNALVAGTVQDASGARVIQEKILANEGKGELFIEYWLGRAGYYYGRREWDETVSAYRRALALCKNQEDQVEAAVYYQHNYYQVLQALMDMLYIQKRYADCSALMKEEIESFGIYDDNLARIYQQFDGRREGTRETHWFAAEPEFRDWFTERQLLDFRQALHDIKEDRPVTDREVKTRISILGRGTQSLFEAQLSDEEFLDLAWGFLEIFKTEQQKAGYSPWLPGPVMTGILEIAEKGENPEQAVASAKTRINELMARGDNTFQFLLRQGDYWLQRDDMEEAARFYEKALAVMSPYEGFLFSSFKNICTVYTRNGDWETLIETLEKQTRRDLKLWNDVAALAWSEEHQNTEVLDHICRKFRNTDVRQAEWEPKSQ